MSTPEKPPIMLIHGLWMTPASWQGWADRFITAGHQVIAPAWPGLEGRSVDDIRRDPSALHGLAIKAVVDRYEAAIDEFGTEPIIIGHSFGGLFTQMLLDRGRGIAGVAVDPAQPSGVPVLPFSTLRSSAKILLNPFTYNAVVPLTPKQFHYAFTNSLSEEESQAVYEEFHIPGAAHILWQAGLGLFGGGAGTVDFTRADRAPLLLIGGSADHIAPPAIQKGTLKRYAKGPALVEYREFPGRTHYTVGQPGWEEVADAALSWALEHRKTAAR